MVTEEQEEDMISKTSRNNDNQILVVEEADRPDRYPYVVLNGNSANLSAVRGTDAQTRSIFFDERNKNTDDDNKNDYDDVSPSSQSPPPLLMESSVLVSLMAMADVDADDYDGVNENEKNTCNNNNNNNALVRGEIFITNTQVLFVAIERDQSHYDLAIGAACIVLHAMTDEPELSLYLQLSSSNSDQEGRGGQQQQEPPPTEVTFTPIHNNNDNDCQKIFDALCKLVSLHPIEPDDDDDGNNNNEQGNGMFGFGGGVSFGDDGGDFDNDDDDDDDGFIWAPATSASNTMTMASPSGTNGTPSERDVMLERLDNLLSVRPEFEINNNEDGQFDDAIEDNDFNNNINEQEN